MTLFIDSVILTCVVVLLTLWYRRKPQPLPLPPGPKPLPVIGSLHLLGDKPHKSLASLSKIYGPLMSLKLGQVTTIIVSSADMAKEVLQTHDRVFSSRSIPDAIEANNHSGHGVTWLEPTDKWRNLRKIGNNYIFARAKLDMRQDLRRKKIQDLLQEVENCSRDGKEVDIGQAAFRTTLNLLSNTFFSVDLAETQSENARPFKHVARRIMQVVGKANLADYFPVLKFVDPQGIRRSFGDLCNTTLKVIDRLIDERLRLRKGGDRANTSGDVLDTLLDVAEEKDSDLDVEAIRHLFLELLTAGNDTTSTMTEWTMTELLRNREALAKLQQELKETVGRGKPVEESDASPYLQAVIKETFRLHPPVTLLVPRKCTSDVEIDGYLIPKNAKILINAWAIGRDPKIWENPESFIPERFLDSDIDYKGRHFGLIPFGGGRRMCPGQPLASRMLYQMVGSLVNSFEWKVEDEETLDVDDEFGLALHKARGLKVVPVQLTD